MENSKNETNKNTLMITQIMSICEELGVEINPNTPTEKNKFLSAWHKSSTTD